MKLRSHVRAGVTATLCALVVVLGTVGAYAQEASDCYPLPAEECVEVEDVQFTRDVVPAVAPTDVQRTHPVTGLDLQTALLVATAAGLVAAGLYAASRRAEAATER